MRIIELEEQKMRGELREAGCEGKGQVGGICGETGGGKTRRVAKKVE